MDVEERIEELERKIISIIGGLWMAETKLLDMRGSSNKGIIDNCLDEALKRISAVKREMFKMEDGIWKIR